MDPRPRRKLAVLTCMDTRLDVYRILDLERGDAHIIRNAGGLVTDDALRSLTISQRMLGTEEIVVMMHDGCGLQAASEEELAERMGLKDDASAFARGAFDDVEQALDLGLARLRSAPTLIARDAIRGLVFDPSTDELREVDPPPGV
ncbi:MAG TPA: carbonic anhydrase [Solirubrobacterales bacterium]|nr:carbonic anhydrase [Solirubrobacterales bacterium]